MKIYFGKYNPLLLKKITIKVNLCLDATELDCFLSIGKRREIRENLLSGKRWIVIRG